MVPNMDNPTYHHDAAVLDGSVDTAYDDVDRDGLILSPDMAVSDCEQTIARFIDPLQMPTLQHHCHPLLDHDGLCHCNSAVSKPHSPFLPSLQWSSYPLCRNESFRVSYIDDALVAQSVKLDFACVKLLPTLSLQSRLSAN